MACIIVTGIDGGEDKQGILKSPRVLQAFDAVAPGCMVEYYDVGAKVIEYAKDARLPARKDTILHLPNGTLYTLRQRACKFITEQIEGDKKRCSGEFVALVGTHAYFQVKNVPKRTIDKSHRELHADFCTTLVDNVEDVRQRLARDPRFAALTFEDILEWQEHEIEFTDLWAEENIEGEAPKSFILAVPELEHTLPRLALRRETTRRVYLSFPMTHATPDIQRRKQRFVERLRHKYVVFDPGSLKDYDFVANQRRTASARGEHTNDLDRLLQNVGNKTVRRDYSLISQSDMVIVYYPPTRVFVESSSEEARGKRTMRCALDGTELLLAEDEKFLLSAGVISEMVTCFERGNHVYAVWLSGEEPSPFFTYHCKRIFKGANAEEEILAADLA